MQYRAGAESRDLTGAEDDVHCGWYDTLHGGEHVCIDAQLEDVLGLRGPGELRVGDIIGELAQGGGDAIALQEEVGVAVPPAVEERALIDDIVAIEHGTPCRVRAIPKRTIGGYFDHRTPLGAQSVEIGFLVLDALLLQEHGVFIIGREGGGGCEIADVEDRRVSTSHEVHEVACREDHLPLVLQHPVLLRYGSMSASTP